MQAGRQGAAVLLVWLGAISLLGYYVQRELTLSADLRLFMPVAQTPLEEVLLDEVGDSPASRLLLLALFGAEPEALAESSQALTQALRKDPAFEWVANGEAGLDTIPEALLAYRYLLSPSLDLKRLDAATLRSELTQRLQDLASPAGALIENWITRDPTLEALSLAESWQPAQLPQRLYDVWFDRYGRSALLMVAVKAAAFDPDAQRSTLAILQRHLTHTRADPHVRLTISGTGAFSALMKETTQREAQRLGTLASGGMVIILLLAYRRPSFVVLGVLPLASAVIAGLAAVSAAFGTVHGITLAFGFTLIGVAQDYPMHLFSHQQVARSPLAIARFIWPTLATGVVSTCIAYLAFLRSGVVGLQQLACFAITGLAVAALTTRYLLPRLLSRHARDLADAPTLQRLSSFLASIPHSRWLAPLLAAVCIGVLSSVPGPWWENDLRRLTPVPQYLLEQDAALRQELGAPDVRYLGVVYGNSMGEVLQRLEALHPRLAMLVQSGAIAGYDHAARYIPSAAVQRRRQAALPTQEALQAQLNVALQGLPFKPDVFTPFIEEVEQARRLPPLTLATLAGTPLEVRIKSLLVARTAGWTGLITFAGVQDPRSLQRLSLESQNTLSVLDLKQAAEDLVARQRGVILTSLAIAAVLLVAAIFIALRSIQRTWRVLTPMLVSTLIVLAVLQASGIALNLFHLISLVLAAGLGVDYALFFEATAHDPQEQRRTLHAVLVCALCTLMVFVLLALSTLPVLRAIGLTVSIGVVSNFVLALLLNRSYARS